MIQLDVGAATHVGRNPGRTNNEDRYLVADGLWVVADGVGGHAGGEVAAGLAVEVIGANFDAASSRPLASAIELANRAVWDRAGSDPELHGMATTITAVALLEPDGAAQLNVANVGDSRTYLLREGELTQLSIDHSQVAEMVRDGLISRAEAARHPYRHVVTRVLGMDSEVSVDTWDLTPASGDRFLLCSDGLIDEIDDPSIAEILKEGHPAQATVDHLVTAALDHGGSDNVTIVLVDVVAVDEAAGAGGDSDAGSAAPAEAVPVEGAEPVPAADMGAAAEKAEAGVAEADAAPGHTEVGPSAAPLPAEPPPVVPPASARAVTGVVPAVNRRRLTPRVVLFIIALVVVIGGAVYSVYWYARGGYYVGLSGTQVTIYKGRPGGVLWFKPTVTQRTGVTTAEVLSSSLPQLQSGMEEATLADARQYVSNLVTAYQAATPSPTTTTSAPPTGTVTPSTTSTSVP